MPVEKTLTILHSNDIHGDFLPKDVEGVECGGISRLSGYLRKARAENPDTLYVIAGDMFRGSIIDSEYKGLSTIELINMLQPDVATIGNHEVDYGVAHLLFLEKCARFPIINANMFITTNNSRLFTPYINITVNGIRILLIGILTQEVLATTRQESVIGTFLDIEEAAKEVGIICDNYRTTSTDLTILVTHIGYEKDLELAQLLDPDYGVDLIIGGHSHTLLPQPVTVNGIRIVQAGSGTTQIGRMDITFNTIKKYIASLSYQMVPINENTAPRDTVLEETLDIYKGETDRKYRRIVTRLARTLTHPCREQETEVGNLYSDIMQEDSSFDIMMFGSGSIRKQQIGPIIEYQDLLENTPFDDNVYMLEVTGEQFRRMVTFIMRDEAWQGDTEFYQFSKGVRILWSRSRHELLEFKFNGEDITDDMRLKIALQNYHYKNFDEFLGVPLEEVKQNMKPKVVATSVNNILEEYLSTHMNLDAHVEGRIEVVD